MTDIVKSPHARDDKAAAAPQARRGAYVAAYPKSYLRQSIGSGQCIALVERASSIPSTSSWRRGVPVKGADIAPGTIIATFDPDGRYGNHTMVVRTPRFTLTRIYLVLK